MLQHEVTVFSTVLCISPNARHALTASHDLHGCTWISGSAYPVDSLDSAHPNGPNSPNSPMPRPAGAFRLELCRALFVARRSSPASPASPSAVAVASVASVASFASLAVALSLGLANGSWMAMGRWREKHRSSLKETYVSYSIRMYIKIYR